MELLITDINGDSKEIATPQDYIIKLNADRTAKLGLVNKDTLFNKETPPVTTPNPNEKLPIVEMGANLEATIVNQQPKQDAYPNPVEQPPIESKGALSASENIFDAPEYQAQHPTTDYAGKSEQMQPETTPHVDIPINIDVKSQITDASQIGVEKDQPAEIITEENLFLMHMVKENEDIYKISSKLGVSPEDLATINNLSSTDTLIPRTMLFVPIKKNKLSRAELQFFQALLPKMQNIFVEKPNNDEYQNLNGIGEMQL